VRRPRATAANGFTIVEPVILMVMLVIISAGTSVLIDSINRNSVNARLQIKVSEDIESDIATVRGVADRLTCCSGTCLVATINAATGLATFPSIDSGTATSSCATNNPRNGAFFFPTRDDTTTTAPIAPSSSAREPDAVTEFCANNTVTSPVMTPLLTAVNALPNPLAAQNITRVVSIQPNKVLRVIYRETVPTTRDLRLISIVPPMANFCT
jgi:type II secretory pathway pseudopilin PulG